MTPSTSSQAQAFHRRIALDLRRLLCSFAGLLGAVALAACSNPTQGTNIANTSTLPNTVHPLPQIPTESLFIGETGRISVFSDAVGLWTPTNQITDHVTHEPRALGIDTDGDLFVADYADVSQISLYRLRQDGKYVGALTRGIKLPTQLALDAHNDLAVVTYNERMRRTVRVFPSAASDKSYELQDVSGPRYLEYGANNDLFVANADNNSIGIYHPGQALPAQILTDGISAPAALAFNHAGLLLVANFGGFNVTAYKGPNYKLVSTVPTRGLHPVSIATMDNHIYVALISHLKSEVVDYNSTTGRSTRIIHGINDPFQVMICSTVYLCVANRDQKVTIYQDDQLVHTIHTQRAVWSMTTR